MCQIALLVILTWMSIGIWGVWGWVCNDFSASTEAPPCNWCVLIMVQVDALDGEQPWGLWTCLPVTTSRAAQKARAGWNRSFGFQIGRSVKIGPGYPFWKSLGRSCRFEPGEIVNHVIYLHSAETRQVNYLITCTWNATLGMNCLLSQSRACCRSSSFLKRYYTKAARHSGLSK